MYVCLDRFESDYKQFEKRFIERLDRAYTLYEVNNTFKTGFRDVINSLFTFQMRRRRGEERFILKHRQRSDQSWDNR